MKQIINTPWGVAQTAHHYAEGIDYYETATHGGFVLSPERDAEVLRRFTDFHPWAGPRNYEEDCDWSMVVVTFPEYFQLDAIQAAQATARHIYDGAYARCVDLASVAAEVEAITDED